MYFTDRGIEELDERRGDEQVSIGWLAERLRDYVDEHPDAEATIDGLASWLARLDDDDGDVLHGDAPAGYDRAREPDQTAERVQEDAEAGE